MRIGRVQGKPIVAYESVEEARLAKSCITCEKYRELLPCKFYAICRAGKGANDPPYMYLSASDELVNSRLTEFEGEVKWT